ncbi:MAG: carboxypeptidase-like regulatory domain-containing protein [Pyrinomonadaceae bacterium]|nr:carboxypeptidase-like regulatory domain-containing protein [Pyrinomonadaceae bacterium]
MRIKQFTSPSFILKSALFILLTVQGIVSANAQTVTFGQFIQRNGTQDFIFMNNGANADFTTIANGTPVLFTYQNIANLPAELQGVQFAHLFISATTTAPAFQTAPSPVRNIQQFNQTFTIRIIRDTPATPGNGSGTLTNLLTAVVTPPVGSSPSLSGDDAGNSAAFTASTPEQAVAYSSDFIGFISTNSRNLGLSFSSINPLFSIGAGSFLNSFTAAGTGTFASNPVPIFNPPTAANVVVSGQVFDGNGNAVSQAKVNLTNESGVTITRNTNSFGAFTFDEVPAGQTVVISVVVKGLNYAPQVLTLNENAEGLAFYPQ